MCYRCGRCGMSEPFNHISCETLQSTTRTGGYIIPDFPLKRPQSEGEISKVPPYFADRKSLALGATIHYVATLLGHVTALPG